MANHRPREEKKAEDDGDQTDTFAELLRDATLQGMFSEDPRRFLDDDANNTPFPNACICLVEVEQIDEFERRKLNDPDATTPWMKLNPAALALLRRFPRRKIIIGFGGVSRVGKSTMVLLMLRRLIEKAGGTLPTKYDDLFRAAASHVPVTSGIWMWGSPLTARFDNEDVCVVLLDTEGYGRNNDLITAQLTTLTCFLSSTFMLLVNDFPNNNDLKMLACISHRLTIDTSGPFKFPKLIVASRNISGDWLANAKVPLPADVKEEEDTLDMIDFSGAAFHSFLDKLIMDHFLGQIQADPTHEAERKSVRDLFKQGTHYVLSVAGDRADLAALKHEAKKPFPHLLPRRDSPFARAYDALLERVLVLSPVKEFDGITLSGDYLVKQFVFFFTQVRQNTVAAPSLLFALQMQTAEDLQEPLVAKYKEAMGDVSTFESSEALEAKHKICMEDAVKDYCQQLELKNFMADVLKRATESLNHTLTMVFVGEYKQKFQELHMAKLSTEMEKVQQEHAETKEELASQKERVDTLQKDLLAESQKLASAQEEMKKTTEALIASRRAVDDLAAQLHNQKGKRRRCFIL